MVAMTQNGRLAIDDNDKPVMGGTSSANDGAIINAAFDPITRRLLTDSAGGSGTVTEFTFNDANGFEGTVTNPSSTPELTLEYTGTLPIANGGTGLTSISAKSIWAANSANVLVELTPGAGQSVRINAGDTAWEVYTPSTSTGIPWTEVTGTSQAAAVNNGYILNNAGLVTLTIPTTAAVGDVVRVVGKGAGGWLIAQNASENINFGALTTTTGAGGSLASTNRYDCVELVCTVANTTWTVASSIGNITVV